VSLGLNRVWLQPGDVAYRQGERAESMYVIISGRVRLVRQARNSPGLHVDEEVTRGDTIGAVWAVTGGTHDTSAVAERGCELVRLSRGSFQVCLLALAVCSCDLGGKFLLNLGSSAAREPGAQLPRGACRRGGRPKR
jgi:CRP-like cAMP-binding protein